MLKTLEPESWEEWDCSRASRQHRRCGQCTPAQSWIKKSENKNKVNQKKNTCYSQEIPLDGEPWTAPSAPSRLTQPWRSLNLIYELLQGWLSVFDLWVFRCGLLPTPSSNSVQMENMLHYVGHQHETTRPTFSYRDVREAIILKFFSNFLFFKWWLP